MPPSLRLVAVMMISSGMAPLKTAMAGDSHRGFESHTLRLAYFLNASTFRALSVTGYAVLATLGVRTTVTLVRVQEKARR